MQEPYELNVQVRICAGDARQRAFLPRHPVSEKAFRLVLSRLLARGLIPSGVTEGGRAGRNLHSFVNNQPTWHVDALGLQPASQLNYVEDDCKHESQRIIDEMARAWGKRYDTCNCHLTRSWVSDYEDSLKDTKLCYQTDLGDAPEEDQDPKCQKRCKARVAIWELSTYSYSFTCKYSFQCTCTDESGEFASFGSERSFTLGDSDDKWTLISDETWLVVCGTDVCAAHGYTVPAPPGTPPPPY